VLYHSLRTALIHDGGIPAGEKSLFLFAAAKKSIPGFFFKKNILLKIYVD
jgi:hypothetical protein